MVDPLGFDLNVHLGDDISSDAAPVMEHNKDKYFPASFRTGLKAKGMDNMDERRNNFQGTDSDNFDQCDSAIYSDYQSADSAMLVDSIRNSDIQIVSKDLEQMRISPQSHISTRLSSDSNSNSETVPKVQLKDSERIRSDEGIGSNEVLGEIRFTLRKEAFEQNSDGDNAIHLAIIHVQPLFAICFIQMVEKSYFLDVFNDLFQTPLHLSVITHQPQVTRALVLAGASLDLQDRHGNTALHLACKHGYLDCVGALTTSVTIEEVRNYLGDNRSLRIPTLPQNLELKNFDGYTCTHLSTLTENEVLLEHLVKLGANINAADDKSGRRPLHFAVEANNFSLAKLVLERLHASVDATTFDLCTPLHITAGRNYKELVLLLLNYGANPQVLNTEGLSPARLAQSSDFAFVLQPPSHPGFRIN